MTPFFSFFFFFIFIKFPFFKIFIPMFFYYFPFSTDFIFSFLYIDFLFIFPGIVFCSQSIINEREILIGLIFLIFDALQISLVLTVRFVSFFVVLSTNFSILFTSLLPPPSRPSLFSFKQRSILLNEFFFFFS